tara:strand:- start:36791 stop:38095 length:1305 start_codon:yes stop_codon:yes gene_type:complete
MADDAGIGDFGCYGGKIIHTPNVDRMARDGLRFTQHYSGSTVCAPSRSVLMTGQHTGHTRVRGNGRGHLLKEDVTVAELMKDAGYVTGAAGKWGLGSATDEGAPWDQGFDLFFGYLDQRNAHHYYPEFLWRSGVKETFPGNPTKRTHYSHDLFTQEALAFIRRHHREPFFLYMPYTVPHVDLDVPDDSKAPYLGKLEPETPYGTPGGQHYRHEKHPHATFAGMISRLDGDVGKILQLLDELQISENTLVFFTSDNGATSAGGADPHFFDSNGPYRGVKRDLYEGGIITPMIARWPGKIAAGSTTDHLSGFQDFLPTMVELVGGKMPENIDGISMLPTLMGNTDEQKKHDYLYWEFGELGSMRALRHGKWKLVQRDLKKKQSLPVELYNLQKDPAETTDLAENNTKVLKRLTKIMDSARTTNEVFPLFYDELPKD